jgi:hypothetical protein
MKGKRLKEIVNMLTDDVEVFIRNSHNPCGNISELEQVEISKYGFFGKDVPCIILNAAHCKGEGVELDLDFVNNNHRVL